MAAILPRLLTAEVDGMEDGLAQEQVEERSVVGLDDEEKELFERDAKDGGAEDGGFGVGPDGVLDEVRVPGRRGDDGNLGCYEQVDG